VTCVRVEAEECPEISDHCSVAVVPLFLFFSRGKEVDRLEGAEPAELTSKFLGLANGGTPETTAAPPPPASNGHAPPPSVQTPPLKPRLDALVRQQPVMLFMKGSPDAPKCGFSRKVVEALRATDTPFGSFDILSDEAVRQGLKEYSNWPTYPQLYVNGELLGGCDIVLELAEAGELKGELAAAGAAAGGEEDAGNAPVDPKAALKARLEGLVRSQPVMLFMKGECRKGAVCCSSVVYFGSLAVLARLMRHNSSCILRSEGAPAFREENTLCHPCPDVPTP